MRSPSPSTAVRTLSTVVAPTSSGLYPPGLKRVAIGPNAQMPSDVFTNRNLTPGRLQAPPRDGVERHGGEQDDPGRDQLRRVRRADQRQAVRDRRDHERSEQGADDAAAAAEEAGPADHGSRDRLEQDRAAARIQVDGAQPRGEYDPAHRGHRPGDHEHDDPDERDVDPGAPRRLGVAADRVDVPPERRPRGDERPDREE